MSNPTTIAALRSLVAAPTPVSWTRSGNPIATGVPAIDAALGGGLPRGRITELVSAAPGSGSGLVLGALLAGTRAARQRLALIDATDAFAPHNHPADLLRHLVWVRARSLPEALGCADVLVRDGHYAVLVLDVQDVPDYQLRRHPAAAWHRLRLAAEAHPGAVLIQSRSGVVPAAPWRLRLETAARLGDLRRPHAERLAALAVAVERGHRSAAEERAG